MLGGPKLERKWQVAILTPMGIMFALLLYHLFVPMPTMVQASKRHRAEEVKMKSEIQGFKAEILRLHKSISEDVWGSSPDEIGANVMAVVDKASHESFVKMQAIRPQKPVSVAGVTRFSYLVVMEGNYPGVLDFLRRVEKKGTKLAVSSVQLSGADGATDNVTATIGVAAFIEDKGKNSNVN